MAITTTDVKLVLEADYTEALTLLLRYPIPPPPHNAPTFVADALYLRDNLSLDGGDHIISKYSARVPETTVTRKLPKKVKRARTADQAAAQRALATPKTTAASPTKVVKEQRDISGIIQEAAKGVYLQGEKWGVAKALRGAVQGIQATSTTPRRASERSHWSLDNGRLISESPRADLVARIESLEQRNKALAKLLENAVSELWTQQNAAKEKISSDSATNEELSLAVARVQFVQVYLENSNMALPSDSLSPADEQTSNEESRRQAKISRHQHQPSNSLDGVVEASRESNPAPDPNSTRSSPRPTDSTRPPLTPNTTRSGSDTDIDKTKLPLSPSLRPRPALAQSPYSWMLGEEQRKSAFVAASPFASDARDARGRKGSLFGDDAGKDGSRRASTNMKGHSRARGLDGEDEQDSSDDVFTMGALRAEADK